MVAALESFDELSDYVASYGRAFRQIGYNDYLRTVMRDLEILHGQYFEAEQDPESQEWAALAASTVAEKGHDRILYRTGHLMRSLTDTTQDSIRELFDGADLTGIVFGTSVPYSESHDRPRGSRPARVHVGVDDEVVDAMADRAADYAVAQLLESV